jgi:hypothetical protein
MWRKHMPDRRTFLITCASVAASPVLAHVGLPTDGGSVPASHEAAPPTLVLRVDGWDTPVDSASDVWVQVNSSWRAAWR